MGRVGRVDTQDKVCGSCIIAYAYHVPRANFALQSDTPQQCGQGARIRFPQTEAEVNEMKLLWPEAIYFVNPGHRQGGVGV